MSGKENARGKTPDRFVLDSFALLAYLEGEAAAGDVENVLNRARRQQADIWMSVINLGEVLYITEREQSLQAAQIALSAVDQLPVVLVDADRSLTLDAAHVKAHHSVSYADAFAVSLAMKHNAAIITGDPEFGKVESLAPVHWIPQRRSKSGTSAGRAT